MPALAAEPCAIYVLPDLPKMADLETGYDTRGAQVKLCDGWRQLAVATFEAEHQLEDQWLEAREKRARPWWKFGR